MGSILPCTETTGSSVGVLDQMATSTGCVPDMTLNASSLKFTKLVGKHHPNIFEFMEAMTKEQAVKELKPAQHNATIPPPQKKKYQTVNQRLPQFKQEYVMGERSVLSFLLADGHLLKLE